MKRWTINKPDAVKSAEFCAKCDLSPLAVDVMTSRGVKTFEQLVSFFNSDELYAPDEIKDIKLAASYITKAIDAYELICIYGDYDCDGVTSTAVLYSYLDSIGANVMYYIPERSDGYGLNEEAIRKLSDMGVKLIVTVDNGIAAVNEAELIKELDMKLVVTDHHQPPEVLPDALAIVDPHQSDCPSRFKDLCGVGVALKLCAELDDGNYDIVLEQFADICAIGTVADVVPLRGENRTIVKKGLEYLKNTEKPGLVHLMELTGINREQVKSSDIGFRLAPVINASGRFGSPLTAVKMLLSDDEDEASSYAQTLVNLNKQRKQAELEIMNEIVTFINNNPELLDHRVLVVSGKGWHHGVIGIISARIMEFYGKPCFVISTDDSGEARGSARSIKGFSVFKCLQHCSEVLTKFGGHECAGGLSLREEDIERFTRLVYEYSDPIEQFPRFTLTADKLLQPADITLPNVKGLSKLEPFGDANSQPVFAMLGVLVKKIIPLSQGAHTKIEYTYGSSFGQALFFMLRPENACFGVGDKLDLLVNLDVNVFGGNESVSVKVIDHRLHGVKQERYFAAKDCYEKLRRSESLPESFIKKIIPSREELISVYKYIGAVRETTLDTLFMRLSGDDMNYCKLRLCIDIFAENELISFKPATGKIKWIKPEKRADLESSETLVKLRSLL